jgi:cell division protein ZapA
MADSEQVVTVEIQGQRYPIRSALDPDYIARLARYLDDKLKAAAETTPTSDGARLTILAALNITDELFRCRERSQDRDGHLAARAHELEAIVDRLLMV